MGNEAFDAFVSYARADLRHALDIVSVLRAQGLVPFFDRSNLPPGLPWVRQLEEALNAAKAAIILIGPHGLGNTQQYERDLAIFRQTRDSSFPIVPVILPDTNVDRPFNFLNILTWIDFSHVSKVSDAPAELDHLLAAVRGTSVGSRKEALCPYRGLDAFREEDSVFFFGRGNADDPESAIGQLVRKVREHPFVMVVGRSGSGKSSLVYAGLVPALRRARDGFWSVLSLRPGSEPIEALAMAFNPQVDDEGSAKYAAKIGAETDQLRTGDPDLLSRMIRRELDRSEGKPDRLLLYVDQWEELYAQAPSPSVQKERAARHAADVNRFIDLLLNASQSAPVSVVATVRADFYDPLISHQKIQALLPTRQVVLGAMWRTDLESTIVLPAKMVGLTFDPPKLVSRILDEAGEDEGMLPLLQYALKETWALREGSVMTAASYARAGGVREAIRLTAERTFNELSSDDQQAARKLFLRLVTPGEGQEDTRARAAMPDEPALRKIVDQFASPHTRLLVTDRTPGSEHAARPTVEVAHEALIRTWPRLREWVDANREKLRARAAVLQAKAEWEQQRRRGDLLLPSGFQLARARALLAEPGDLTIDDIQEFIALSSAREETERKEREEALAREEARVAEIKAGQERTARLQRTARWTLAAAALAVVIGLAAGLWLQKINSTQRLVLNQERLHLLAEIAATEQLRNKRESALRLAAHAVRLDLALGQPASKGSRPVAALAALVSQTGWRLMLSGHDNLVVSAAFSFDGSRIVSASFDGTARVWDAATGLELMVLRGHDNFVASAAFSRDGSRIVSASSDGTARIWDAATGKEIAVLRGHDAALRSAAFGPDGSRIVTASADQTARIWDAAGRQLAILRGHQDQVSAAAFSPDGSRIVTASADQTARIWETATGKEIAVLRGQRDQVSAAAFSPDGSRIVTASVDRTARIWDAATGAEIAVLRGHEDQVFAAAFSPDGAKIVTASTDQTARIWDATGKQLAVLRGHNNLIASAAFSPDGSRIVTASFDNSVRVWDTTGSEVAVLRGHEDQIDSAAFSFDGSRIVTASNDMTARIWNAATAKEVAVLRGHEAEVNSAAFSPDGSRIVTASGDQTARIWDAATGKEMLVLRGHEDQVFAAAFSPGGAQIATASADQTARIWDVKLAKRAG